jgi:hypothetical protein
MAFGLSFQCLSSRKNLMSLRSSSSRQAFRFLVVTSQNSQFPEFLTILRPNTPLQATGENRGG